MIPRPGTPALPGAPPHRWGARWWAEVLAVELLAALSFWAGMSWPALGPFAGLGYALGLLPLVHSRWDAPFPFYAIQFLLPAWIVHAPLSRFGWYVAVALPPLLSMHFLATGLLARLLARVGRVPPWLAIALAIPAGEWTRPLLGVGSYDMYEVGTMLWDWPRLIQGADLVGSRGLSFAAALAWGVLLVALVPRDRSAPARPHLRAGAALAATAWVLLLGWSFLRLPEDPRRAYLPGPRIALVQPSENHSRQRTPRVLRVEQQMTVKYVEPGSVDLVAWPENAVLAPLRREPAYLETVTWVSRKVGAPLLLGTQDFGPDGRRPTNTAFLLDGDGRILGRVDKVVLFPFTERRALSGLRELFPPVDRFLTRLTLKAWREAPHGWSPDRPSVVRWRSPSGEDWSFWTPICYESSYPRLARQARLAGARFLVNLASEGWLGRGVAWYMLGANVLRAVENRFPLARCANTGITALVYPDGRIDRVLRGLRHGRTVLDIGVLTGRLWFRPGGPTVYTRIGRFLDPGWFVAAVVLVLAGLVRRLRRGEEP